MEGIPTPAYEIVFRINDEIINLSIPLQETEDISKLTNNDGYTSNYIIELINNGLISIREPLQRIWRVEGESNILIYTAPQTAQVNKDTDNEDCQEVGSISEGSIYSLQHNEDNDSWQEEAVPFSDGNVKHRCDWTDAETKVLLEYYEQFMSNVGPMKKFKNKRNMWNKITDILNKKFNLQRTSIQVENRYKTVLKRKKSAVENNRRTGSSRMDIPFEEELNKISSLDDSIEPEVLGTAQNIQVLKPIQKENITPSVSQSIKPVRKHKSIHETLIEIHKQKEDAKERRHKEKLELIRELFKRD
ncbi:unnamed protein product [Phaedon cochleariae]|uniref:Myb-like domain-containing protein n=1 Tax=Phaedon cochleariae TaxID=80249 RepID=A0A9P0DH35_PHACE|nr:unnamed protein product [Phaedon cochleariae]